MRVILNKLAAALLLVAYVTTVVAAPVNRITIFADGNVLTAAQLNDEFDNVITGINSVNDAQVVEGAAIAPSKLSASIAGDGLSRNPSNGSLSVSVDDSTLEIQNDTLAVKDGGITGVKLTNSTVDDVTLERVSNQIRVKDDSITQVKLATRVVATSAPAGGLAISADSGTFSSTSFSYVDVTNLSVTLVTTGRPVWIGLIPGSTTIQSYVGALRSNNESTGATLLFVESPSTTLAVLSLYLRTRSGSTSDDPGSRQPCSAFSTVVYPSAGTYTYKVQIGSINGTGSVQYCKLAAYEL